MTHQSQIRWYNPKLDAFEWREVPESDEDVSALLAGYPGCQHDALVYREWRTLGASITTALIRVGGAAKEDHDSASGC